MARKHTAQCACGAVKFEFNTDPTFVAVCHCLDCKKSSGGEAATFFGVPEDDFTLISGEPKAFHYIAQSGRGLPQLLPAMRRQGVQQQPGRLPRINFRHSRQPG
jgi:Glutathione-dependent formaldehyde-activating enzyme